MFIPEDKNFSGDDQIGAFIRRNKLVQCQTFAQDAVYITTFESPNHSFVYILYNAERQVWEILIPSSNSTDMNKALLAAEEYLNK